ncbi:MAG: tRNA preQ1(34) S-adenosylmethionine ribosyltransferase-isomerase QueA [Gammaproteobacteria bacterium]
MQLNDFDYQLPNERIARYPLTQRSASRLLCLSRTTGKIAHQQFKDFINYLNPGDLLVFNNTKVIPARLYAKKITGGQCEILVERLVDEHHCWAHVRASKAPIPGTHLYINDEVYLVMESRDESLFYLSSETPLPELLNTYGHIPLPQYLEREDEQLDQERYQTVYAQTAGAVAAPTAGLHFDEELLKQIQAKGVRIAYVTLHVGAGTFQPVRVENILEHKMHYEYAEINQEVCALIKKVKAENCRVIAIGTTSARTLESAALHGELQPFQGETNLFIYPGFKFQVIDGLLTNFHLPKSTLLMLVSAFAGRESVLAAYQEAIEHKYRFFSYGDAVFIS